MGTLSEWAARFEDNIILQRLVGEGNSGVFMTYERCGIGVPCYSYTSPVYHIWINDKYVMSCMNGFEAMQIYERSLQ